MTLGELALLISVTGAVPYLAGVVRGRVRPQRMSWFIWTIILVLGLWSYRASGSDDSTWYIVGELATTGAIFLFSLWRGSGGWSRLDLGCLVVAVVGIGLWQMLDESAWGVFGALMADAVAVIPTLVKSLQDPESESASAFLCSALGACFGVLAVGSWNLLILLYPTYLFLANFVVALVIVVGQYRVRRLGMGS